ncbi:unnamed protein product [Lampetra planeri]
MEEGVRWKSRSGGARVEVPGGARGCCELLAPDGCLCAAAGSAISSRVPPPSRLPTYSSSSSNSVAPAAARTTPAVHAAQASPARERRGGVDAIPVVASRWSRAPGSRHLGARKLSHTHPGRASGERAVMARCARISPVQPNELPPLTKSTPRGNSAQATWHATSDEMFDSKNGVARPNGYQQQPSAILSETTQGKSAESHAPECNDGQNPSTWYQITFHFEGVMATFSVVDYMAAVKLKARSRKIVYPDNYRAIVLMRPLVGPPSPLAAELTEDDRRLIEPPTPLPTTSADIQCLIASFFKESSLGEDGADKESPENSPRVKRLTVEDFLEELAHTHHDACSFTTTVSHGTMPGAEHLNASTVPPTLLTDTRGHNWTGVFRFGERRS